MAPALQGLICWYGAVVGCGHVFGLLLRCTWPLAIMPSAKTGPDQKHALEALWRKWVFPFSVSTDGALHRDCPSQTLSDAAG